ncbi:hypothetical protein, partial [Allosphingosinicella sp.]|uniref:hypothetical protein n=1 Tax=Allosphingosinicella sp. TaxID=2823234 RepID=UPI002F1E44A4
MRKALCLGLLLATAACGQGADQAGYSGGGGGDTNMAMDVAAPSAVESRSESSARPPGIAPTAAPGVAFNYRYAFRLPGENISRVQEEH